MSKNLKSQSFKKMPQGSASKKTLLILTAILILLSGLAFSPGLKAPFFYDDHNTILMNPGIKSPGSYWQFFYQLDSFSADRARMFRPLVLLSLALNWRYFQENTLAWHLVNLSAHIICVVLVFFLFNLLARDWRFGFLVALLFAIHPSRVAPVIYVSARSELLASLFYLLAFFLFLNAQTAEQKVKELILGVLSLVSFWLGLCSKDIAITLPTILTLERLVFQKLNRKAFFWLLIFWANALIYFLVRKMLDLYTFFPLARPRPVLENLLLQARVLVYYLRWLFFPIHNSVELKLSPVSTGWIIFSIIFLAGALFLGIICLRRKPLLGFLCFFFFIVLSPSSSVVSLVVEGNLVRVYLAGLFVFGVLAELFLSARRGQKRAGIVSLLLIIYFLCLFLLSFNWSRTWLSPKRLWWETVKNFPSNSRARNNLGIQLERAGNLAQAEREYQSAVRYNPQDANALVNYARMLFARDDFRGAEIYFRKAVLLEPFNCIARLNYSQLLVTTERLIEAKEILEDITFCPGYESELAHQKKRIDDLLNFP